MADIRFLYLSRSIGNTQGREIFTSDWPLQSSDSDRLILVSEGFPWIEELHPIEMFSTNWTDLSKRGDAYK